MANDISPELYEAIKVNFNTAAATDIKLKSIKRKVQAGEATQGDIMAYTDRLGRHASNALKSVLTPENLPDGTLYWNIAEKTIQPLLLENYERINYLAIMQQASADQALNINIGIVKGGNPENRIYKVIRFATDAGTGQPLEDALTDPVITAHLKYYDDFMGENVKLRNSLGLDIAVTRKYDGVGLHRGTKWAKPCKYCLDREGTFTAGEAETEEIWFRHVGCKCVILYTTERSTDILTNANKNKATTVYH